MCIAFSKEFKCSAFEVCSDKRSVGIFMKLLIGDEPGSPEHHLQSFVLKDLDFINVSGGRVAPHRGGI